MITSLITAMMLVQSIPFPGPGRAPTGAAASTPWILTQTVASTRNDFDGCAGVGFTMGGASKSVTDLGRWVISGNSQSHTIYLTDNSGTVLKSCSVNTSGATAGAYLYCSIAAETLSASTIYAVMSAETNGGDQWYNTAGGGGGYTTTAIAGTAFKAFDGSGGCGGAAPSSGGGDDAFVPTNFKYTP